MKEQVGGKEILGLAPQIFFQDLRIREVLICLIKLTNFGIPLLVSIIKYSTVLQCTQPGPLCQDMIVCVNPL